jgi:topoisomerase-4 subunit A
LGELQEKWHFSSLEKIFIENRIYRDIEECETWQAVIDAIDKGLKPFKKLFRRDVTEEDIVRLTEIKIKRISKFDSFKADEIINKLEEDIAEVEKNLKSLTKYAIAYFKNLIKKYGKGRERRTEVTSFGVVNRTQVVAINETLFVDRKNGFAGWGLKKEESVEKCSRIDDIIAIDGAGKMRVLKIADKAFIGKRPQQIAIFRKEEDKIYSMIYRDGRQGATYAKRFRVGGVTRDKEYDLTKGTPGTRILYLAIHNTEEESNANLVVVHMKPALRLRNISRPFPFGELAIKGRGVKGNLVTKHAVDRVVRPPKEGGDLELE